MPFLFSLLYVAFLRMERSNLDLYVDFGALYICNTYLGIPGDSFDLQLQDHTVLSLSYYL